MLRTATSAVTAAIAAVSPRRTGGRPCPGRAEGYADSGRSELLPGLDPALLTRFVRLGESLTRLTKAYREALRSD